MSETKDVREAAFQQWWRASKYCQVVFPKDGWEQIARDGFNASWNRRTALEPAPTPAGGETREYAEAVKPDGLGPASNDGSECRCECRATPPSADAQDVENPMEFFAGSVDRWGAAEWFDRLAKAIRAQDKAVVDGNDLMVETYRRIAASSAMCLVRDHEQRIRSALTSPEAAKASEVVRELMEALELAKAYLIEPDPRRSNCAIIRKINTALAAYKRSTTDGNA